MNTNPHNFCDSHGKLISVAQDIGVLASAFYKTGNHDLSNTLRKIVLAIETDANVMYAEYRKSVGAI